MGYDCSSAVSGDSLAALLAAVQTHAVQHHDYMQEEVESEEMIAIWEGAIKQSSRPGNIRAPRLEFGRDISLTDRSFSGGELPGKVPPVEVEYHLPRLFRLNRPE